MDVNQYKSSARESSFAATDSPYQLSGSFPTNNSPIYRPIDEGTFAPNYDLYEERQRHQSMGTGHTEESDMASRSRLTQEQLARLEREFKQRYKPNTEYKRGLAETMGVEYHKINNWFQNRRAKAKHQNPQEPRFDLSTDEDAPEYQTTLYSTQYEGMPEVYSSSHFSSPEQPPFASGDYGASLKIEALNDIQYSNHIDDSRNDPITNSNYSSHGPLQTSFSPSVGPDSVWPANGIYGFAMPKVPTPIIVEHDPFKWSPVSSTELRNQPQSHDFAQSQSQSQSLYLNTFDGHLVGNPSSQTFATASSEGGDHAALITPPQEVSPMPGLNEGIFTRRGSNSSELAENFDTIHLQQSKIGLGLYEHPSHSTPELIPSTGLATPNISPDTIAAKPPFSIGRDLASRRRRPRPAALQPDTARSFSYTGPSTASPHLRLSSPGTGRLSPVRRIKSTGNNLSVATGRITKLGPLTAQKSPRSFESCFQLEKVSQPHPDTDLPPFVPQASVVHSSVPSSAHFSQQPSNSWPNYPSQYGGPGQSWDEGANGNVSLNYAAGLSLPPSPPDQINDYQPTPLEHQGHNQQYTYRCPPQSAPPHLTSFFGGSPPMPSQDFAPEGWPAPSITPPEPYRHNQNVAIPMRPNHMLHHSQSGPYTYFPAPQHGLQDYSPTVGPFTPYQQPFGGLSTPVKKELDIKIEKGPPPPRELLQTSQENKIYSFNNSTPNDFAPSANTRK